MEHNPYTYDAFILETINSERNKKKKTSKRPEQGKCKMHLSPSPKSNQSQKKEKEGKSFSHLVPDSINFSNQGIEFFILYVQFRVHIVLEGKDYHSKVTNFLDKDYPSFVKLCRIFQTWKHMLGILNCWLISIIANWTMDMTIIVLL